MGIGIGETMLSPMLRGCVSAVDASVSWVLLGGSPILCMPLMRSPVRRPCRVCMSPRRRVDVFVAFSVSCPECADHSKRDVKVVKRLAVYADDGVQSPAIRLCPRFRLDAECGASVSA
eukprot:9483150-Pyramimonas_sp.AAC.1